MSRAIRGRRWSAGVPARYKRLEWLDPREGKLPNSDVEYPDLGEPAAFACSNRICSFPSFNAEELQATVKSRPCLSRGELFSRSGSALERMADELGDALPLNTLARSIAQHDDHVVVSTDGLEVAARHAVVAVPPALALGIEFDPPLSKDRLALYRELACDESVILRSRGRELLSALAKLANPESTLLLLRGFGLRARA